MVFLSECRTIQTVSTEPWSRQPDGGKKRQIGDLKANKTDGERQVAMT